MSEAALLELVQESVVEADALFGPAFRKQTRKVRGCLPLLNIISPKHVSSHCPSPPPLRPSVALEKVWTPTLQLQQPRLLLAKALPLQPLVRRDV